MAIDTRILRAASESASPGPVRSTGISAEERTPFTERLALLLETGSPLHTSLQTLQRQAPSDALKTLLERLVEQISEGQSFSQALDAHPEHFSRTYVTLIAAAERGGFLPEILARLTEMDEKRRELNSTLVAALSYPTFLILFSAAVILFILGVVFPRFAELFASIVDQLPWTTLLFMTLSDGLRHYWAALLTLGTASGLLFWRWARTPDGLATVDRLALGIPIARDIIVQLNLVQFMRVMSLSLTHGVPMLEALRSCRDLGRSPTFRAFVDRLDLRVSEGGTFSAEFEDASFLPPLVREMIATGEETGNLATVMARISDFYEREWRRRLTLLSKVAEPVMLLIMGAVVGLIVSSLILPIFKLTRAVH